MIIGAVLVYVGNKEIGTLAAVIDVGGQGNWVLEEAGIDDGVPVCHGRKFPGKRLMLTLRGAHLPWAVRGSFGIHPFCRPSW